jgi:hypothetical protein
MKWLFITLLIFPLSLPAQKKLPINCTELKSKLQLLEKSFRSFEKWKKQLIGGKDHQWTTNQTFCGVKGIVEIYEEDRTVELIFDFTGYDATDAELMAYVKKLSDAITEVFDHLVYSFDKTDGDESGEWYTHNWYDYRVTSSGEEEVELTYPGIDTPLVLKFRYKK